MFGDTKTDPRTAAAFESIYEPLAMRSAIAAPQTRDGVWAATLVVTSHVPRKWTGRELTLVKLAGERIWLWLEHLRLLAKLRDRDVAQAVQKSEERFRALVEGVKDYAIVMLDADGRIGTWNAGAERLQGYTSDEILGKPNQVFFLADDIARGQPAQVLEEARATGRYEGEGWRVRKDGTKFWANIVLTAIHGRDGAIEGFAKVTRDVTERRRNDELLAAKQAALVQSLREREVLLQEVHHRVKNNLQVISSLINMQARRMESGPARGAIEECQSRVLTIALIHEKLYQSKDYSRVEFAEYARSIAANVFQATGTSPREVSLELDIDPIPLGVDRAIPCGLLINELVTNSLKHAFKDGRKGTIRVALKAAGEKHIRLAVEDTGAGLPPDFDVQKAKSMGLQLVVTLSEQLDAELAVSGNDGASFALTFPGDE